MSPVVEILFRRFPDDRLQAIGIWVNRTVVPVLIIGGGTYRTFVTATSPFEQFTGTVQVVVFATMWAFCFGQLFAHRPDVATRNARAYGKFTKWTNALVIATISAGGLYLVHSTATSPFEQFTGTMIALMLAMMWMLCMVATRYQQ